MQEGEREGGGKGCLYVPPTRLLMAITGMCILPLSCAAHRPRRVYSRTLAQAGFGSMHGRLRHPFLTSGGRYIFRATK